MFSILFCFKIYRRDPTSGGRADGNWLNTS